MEREGRRTHLARVDLLAAEGIVVGTHVGGVGAVPVVLVFGVVVVAVDEVRISLLCAVIRFAGLAPWLVSCATSLASNQKDEALEMTDDFLDLISTHVCFWINYIHIRKRDLEVISPIQHLALTSPIPNDPTKFTENPHKTSSKL